MLRIANIFTFLLITSIFSLTVACQSQVRHQSRYLIPQDYIGWVRIDFNVPNAPALSIEDCHYLFKFPLSGHLETSSDMEYGAADDEYFYYSSEKVTKLKLSVLDDSGMIRAGFNGTQEKGTMGNNERRRTATYEYFFVGSDEDLQKYGQEKDGNGKPKFGNLKGQKNTNLLKNVFLPHNSTLPKSRLSFQSNLSESARENTP